MRDFNTWLDGFRASIADYSYYTDFEKVFENVNNIKVELNILNSLIGSTNIVADFEKLMTDYPQVMKCIPILLAKRENEIAAMDDEGAFIYKFHKLNYPLERYSEFMHKTGLFDLMSNRIVSNLVDYVAGVEVGLDSNARKNRGGHLMEDIVERHLVAAGLVKGKTYFKEMTTSAIKKLWGIDLSSVSNNGKVVKRFDFVVKVTECVYGIETNFYASSGSKLNETARSYKNIAFETRKMENFKFVWFTDGHGWFSARHNLQETFEILDNIYSIQDLEQNIACKIFQ